MPHRHSSQRWNGTVPSFVSLSNDLDKQIALVVYENDLNSRKFSTREKPALLSNKYSLISFELIYS